MKIIDLNYIRSKIDEVCDELDLDLSQQQYVNFVEEIHEEFMSGSIPENEIKVAIRLRLELKSNI